MIGKLYWRIKHRSGKWRYRAVSDKELLELKK